MKFKINPLTGEFNLVPDSGTLKQKLNWLTGEFNLTKDASKYKQIYNVIEGEFNLYPAVTQVVIHGVGSVQLTNAVENGLLSLKAYGGTEQSNLPSGYTQLEYIESSGTQYIDTGIIGNQDTIFEGEFAFAGTSSQMLWGNNKTSNRQISAYFATSGTSRFGNASQTATLTQYITVDTFCKITEDKTGIYMDDTQLITFSGVSNFTTDLSMYIGTSRSTSASGFNGKMKRVKIREGTTLKGYYIPCKDSNNVVGMYDTVSGQFFANAGTGTFTAGPNTVPTPTAPIDIVSNNGVLKARHQSGLPIGYTLLDYIKSGGSNYIDTGIKITNEDVIEMQYLQTADKGAIYGEYYNGTDNMSTTLYGNITFYFYPYNAQGTAVSVGNYDNNVHTVVHNFVDGYIDFDGVRTTFNLPDPNSFTNSLNCPIFGRSNGSSIGYFSKTQLYYFRIRRNGTLILDLIPAKDSDNNVGMYDRVSGTLFTESGTGSFTAGNTVSDPMTVYADGVTETIGFGGVFSSVDGQGTYATPGSQYTTRVYKQFGRLPLGTYNVKIEGPFDFIFQYRDTPVDQERTANGNVGSWAKSGEYTITDDMYYGIAIRNDSQTGSITPTDFVNGNGKISIKGTDGNVVAEMLLKIGDYTDEQEILSGDITRNVGVKVLDGTETGWTKLSSANYVSLPKTEISNMVSGTDVNCLSNNFIQTPHSSVSLIGECFTVGVSYVNFKKAGDPTVAQFKQWLADQYNAGTPVIVVYPLATPTTESVAGQTMNIPAGDSTIGVVQASLDKLELEATYEQEA